MIIYHHGMKKCSVKGCTKKYYCKGYCSTHYCYALRHNGNPIPPKRKVGGFNNGYFRFKKDGKSIQYHRFVVEKNLGRKLLSSECIHHIDGNKLNNSINNLLIVSHSEHRRFHAKKQVINEKKQCSKCKKFKIVEENFSFYKKENRWNSWCKKCIKFADHQRYILHKSSC